MKLTTAAWLDRAAVAADLPGRTRMESSVRGIGACLALTASVFVTLSCARMGVDDSLPIPHRASQEQSGGPCEGDVWAAMGTHPFLLPDQPSADEACLNLALPEQAFKSKSPSNSPHLATCERCY